MSRREEKREQKQEDREEFGRGGTATTYKLKDKLFSFGDDFYIEDDRGRKVYKVNGKMIAIKDKLDFEDLHGKTLVEMASKLIQLKDQVRLDRIGGRGAVVKKDLINLVHDKMDMKIDGAEDLVISGNLLDHEYRFYRGKDRVAEVSKKWFRISDTFGVQIEPGQDDILILAACVAVDQLCFDVA